MWFKLYKRFDTAAAAAGGWCKPLHPFCVTTTTLRNLSLPPLVHPHICIVCNCPLHCPTRVGATAHPRLCLCTHHMHNFLAPGHPRPGPAPLPTPSDALLGTPLTGRRLNTGSAWIFSNEYLKNLDKKGYGKIHTFSTNVLCKNKICPTSRMSRPWLDKTHFCGFETSVHPHGEEYEWDYVPGGSTIHDNTSE